MTEEDKINLIKSQIQKTGVNGQLKMAMEECGEFLTALSHHDRGRITIDGLITEIVDVQMMIEAICVLYGISKEDIQKKTDSQYEKFRSQVEDLV